MLPLFTISARSVSRRQPTHQGHPEGDTTKDTKKGRRTAAHP